MIRSKLSAFVLLTAVPLARAADVTDQDIAKMNWKVTSARQYFAKVWQQFFLENVPRLYETPKIISYASAINTACGRLGPGNASFCQGDNTIYYDQEFLAAQMKSVGAALHSDGDYAPIAILAHEWGHAADYWYRYSRKLYSWETFYTEQLADCLAGAVTRSAERAGYLERGDLEEAEHTIQSAGDPINPNRPKTSSEKIDEGWRKLHSHGEPADRLQAFRKGYRGEAAACLADRRLIPVH